MRPTPPNGTATKPPEARIVDDLRIGVDHLLVLGRMELDLAKLEAGSAAKRVGIGAGFVVVALLLLYAGLIIGLGAIAAALGQWYWWLAEGGVLWLVAILIGVMGYRFIKRAISEARGTFESIKGDLEWLRQLASRLRSGS